MCSIFIVLLSFIKMVASCLCSCMLCILCKPPFMLFILTLLAGIFLIIWGIIFEDDLFLYIGIGVAALSLFLIVVMAICRVK